LISLVPGLEVQTHTIIEQDTCLVKLATRLSRGMQSQVHQSTQRRLQFFPHCSPNPYGVGC
jgi:hypothetical protein